MEWIQEANQEKEIENEIMSFSDYVHFFENNQINQARPTFQYLIDMMDFYGKNEEGAFNVFLNETALFFNTL